MPCHHAFPGSKLLLLLAIAGACGRVVPSSSGDPEPTGLAQIALTQVPAGVQCVRITAAGSRTVTKLFDVQSGQSSVLAIAGLPLGTVSFSGDAFSSACALLTTSSVPDWTSDPVSAQVSPGTIASVTLTMHRGGRALVGVDFADDGTADGGASSPDGGAGSPDGGAAGGGPGFCNTDQDCLFRANSGCCGACLAASDPAPPLVNCGIICPVPPSCVCENHRCATGDLVLGAMCDESHDLCGHGGVCCGDPSLAAPTCVASTSINDRVCPPDPAAAP
jgi:hypothetical protein